MPQSLAEAKKRLRSDAAAGRTAAAAGVAAAPERVKELLLAEVPIPEQAIVSGYWPMGDELDPRPAMEALHARGHRLCLPVVRGPRQSLVFRAWRPGDELFEAVFGTHIPDADQPELSPDLLLVPLLGFDSEGYRLGYGGGFYDRTLAELRRRGRPFAVGLAYEGQHLLGLPREETDQRLDWIVTERQARHFA